MEHDVNVDTKLDKQGVRFAERDVELLRAVHEHGSLNKAASTLGRSYSRSQQRVVELEEAFGQLVDRQRGGSGGGGSSLTDTARDLLAEFDRLESEFTGVAEVEESVFQGTVTERDGELGTVETEAGPVRAIVPPTTQDVRLAVRADTVLLHAPGSVPESMTSARNHFQGEVLDIVEGESLARVAIDIDSETDLLALVTQTSIDTLNLSPGTPIVASFKATATRAYPEIGSSDAT
jgi:molybdate transport system regulatory protein